MKTQGKDLKYKICIKGYLGKNAAIWFDGFEIEHTANDETVLRGTIIDQAALHGVLNKINDLGLTLTLVQQLDDEI
jgi:hypothetical protein